MASSDLALLEKTARRAYERGRWQYALRRAPIALLVAAAVAAVCPYPRLALVAGAVLVPAVAVSLWRGQGFGSAARGGLLAGSVVVAVRYALLLAGHACVLGSCWSICRMACVGAGLVAGVGFGLIARGWSVRHATAGAGIALLAAVPACAFAGALGVLGVVLGFVAASAPALALQRAR